jgi:hypothetical protein
LNRRRRCEARLVASGSSAPVTAPTGRPGRDDLRERGERGSASGSRRRRRPR